MYVAPLATRKDRELLATVASFAGFTNRQNVPGRQPAAGLSSSELLAALSLSPWLHSTEMRKTFVITFHRQHHPVTRLSEDKMEQLERRWRRLGQKSLT